MRHLIAGSSVAAVMAAAFTVAAQGAQAPSTTAMNADQSVPGRVTVEGCVMAEEQVAGRDPNFMERAGIGEDFILTNARLADGAGADAASSGSDNQDAQAAVTDADQSAQSGSSVAEDPVDRDADQSVGAASAADQGRADAGVTSGLPGTMFELEGIDDEQLRQHVGQQVRIEGTLENVDQARSREGGDEGANQAADDLAEIEVETLTAIPGGNCAS